MFLEKLEIQGFKSFASKNSLLFPQDKNTAKKKLTAVVGPNGSGKSNIADAVRWVLGEQSSKALRGKKGEDVIFSGSDKKGKLAMAEVSLYLNNEDKSRQDLGDVDSPLHYNEIVITRRLFRNGDSEYLINNKRVRLSDIQMLLAKANFGQKTYSVIGQGLVENFLNTSPAERKDFFDEATGVKKFQIKRDAALNKLQGSQENLEQVARLVAEIEPRLKTLTRQIDKLNKRVVLEKELKQKQIEYFSQLWQVLNSKLKNFNSELLDLEKNDRELNFKLDKINSELASLENIQEESEEKKELENDLTILRSQIVQNSRDLAQIETRIEIGLENSGKFDLSWLSKKQREMKNNIELLEKKEFVLSEELEKSTDNQDYSELKEVKSNINELENKILSFKPKQTEIKSLVSEFWEKFKNLDLKSSNLADQINSLQSDFDDNINNFFSDTPREMENLSELKNWKESLVSWQDKRSQLEDKEQEYRLKISSLRQDKDIKNKQIREIKVELFSIEEKISKQGKQENITHLNKQKEDFVEIKNSLNEKEQKILQSLATIEGQERSSRQKVFVIQREGQDLQIKINNNSARLSELKVRIAREETKQEDLEKDIRQEELLLSEIENYQGEKIINPEESFSRISNIKRQLEIIGGIDKETEIEYQETKERFDFLYQQSLDLENTIKSLEKIVLELDLKIKEQFDLEFKTIDKYFNEYFKKLFSGGQAQLIKLYNADEKEAEIENDEVNQKIKFLKKHNATGLSGIEIKACPPGKKISSINMLSGGERALTAIALICAIISANPAPFVFLDEVDAALDEANSERLAEILDELSHKTQFIAITHNRASMKRSGLIYGVTMGDDGVSKLLSMKLEEIKSSNKFSKLLQ